MNSASINSISGDIQVFREEVDSNKKNVESPKNQLLTNLMNSVREMWDTVCELTSQDAMINLLKKTQDKEAFFNLIGVDVEFYDKGMTELQIKSNSVCNIYSSIFNAIASGDDLCQTFDNVCQAVQVCFKKLILELSAASIKRNINSAVKKYSNLGIANAVKTNVERELSEVHEKINNAKKVNDLDEAEKHLKSISVKLKGIVSGEFV